MISKISFAEQIVKLPLPATEKWPDGVWDITPFTHGTMSVVLFAPKTFDYQTPHLQDELYIVYKGSGELSTTTGTISFAEGDVLFVAASDEHRFENFTDDLVLWAVFWGPRSGENSEPSPGSI